ncbi:MAG: DUF6279 family lipoprotein [Burkholderiaceae bacterium]
MATGCSSTKIGYDTAPLWLGWQLDRYLNLDDAQRELVSAKLEALQRWHRQTQLPGYIAFLKDVESRLSGDVSAADFEQWRRHAVQAWEPVAVRLAPDMAALAMTLRPAQIDRLAQRLADSNDEWRREHMPAEARALAKARGDRLLKRARWFVKDLRPGQEDEIRALAADLPPSEALWLAERQARQQAVVAVLSRIARERPPLPEAERWARETLLGLATSRDPQRREALARSAAASDQASATVLARADASQRRAAAARLRGFADDFRILASR